jgi:hypothetical protein
MAFDTVGDIFNFLKNFHRDLAVFLSRLGESMPDERKRVLLNFVERHEKNMEECMADCQAEMANAMLCAWIKNVPQVPKCRCFEQVQWDPSMSVNEIVARIRQVDGCLLKLYQQLAEKAPTPEVRELFEELLAREQSESARVLAEGVNFLEQN